MLPKSIIQIMESWEYDEAGEMLITRLELFSNDCRIEVDFNSGNENIPNQLLEIQIENLMENRICLERFFDIQVRLKHELLEPYQELSKELYIKLKPKSPNELLKDLYVHHKSYFGRLQEIETYFNTKNKLNELCEMEFGLFAKGPETYLQEVKSILEKQETQPYMFGDFKSKWNGERWVEENSNLKLLLMGRSFFIASDFKCEVIKNI